MDDDRTATGARSLKTAATVLRALRLLGDHPTGLSAHDLATHLDKSVATARYMINTLCDGGYAERDGAGRCRLSEAPPWGSWGGGADDTSAGVPSGTPIVPSPEDVRTGLADADVLAAFGALPEDPDPSALLAEAATELYRRTRQRSYLVRRTGSVVAVVADSRGHQGLAHLPGLGTNIPPQHAHALAMTKVLLAASPTYREAVESEPLAALTAHTLTDVTALRAELDTVARAGVAVDTEEYANGFATVASPVVGPSGTATVALGLSCSSRRLGCEREALMDAVRAVAERARAQWADEARSVDTPTAPRTRRTRPATPRAEGDALVSGRRR